MPANCEDVERQKDFKTIVTISEPKQVTAEWVNKVVAEACNPNSAERLTDETFACLEKYIREDFSTFYVYTHNTSSQEPLTENVRKSMTINVKTSAYTNFLGQKKDNIGMSDENFVDFDQEIFNFARGFLSKNVSTMKPARLYEPLASYVKSIAQILCGTVRGTCFLVNESLIITNYHVCMAISEERRGMPDLQITVRFDYLYSDHLDEIVSVEVDEENDPELESSNLDYIFLRLKPHRGLRNRVGLGAIVRSQQLQEGLVIIVGHPKGKEMKEETCVVVRNHLWRRNLQERQAVAGLHMTNSELLNATDQYEGRLPYETSLFYGSSGSPVFDLKGNIVAMHTQGYTLDLEGRKHSLMEFGVQFYAICEDLRQRKSENVVRNLFRNYDCGIDAQPIQTD